MGLQPTTMIKTEYRIEILKTDGTVLCHLISPPYCLPRLLYKMPTYSP